MSINVVYVTLPRGSHGSCCKNEEPDSYTIFLDPNDSRDMQMYGYTHELEHIVNGDFENIEDKHVQTIERLAHYNTQIKKSPVVRNQTLME